jgi:hypothetical protein
LARFLSDWVYGSSLNWPILIETSFLFMVPLRPLRGSSSGGEGGFICTISRPGGLGDWCGVSMVDDDVRGRK